MILIFQDAQNFVRTHFQYLNHHDDSGGGQSRSGSKQDSAGRQGDPNGSREQNSSRNVDNSLADGQRRKGKERHRHERGNRENRKETDTENEYRVFVNRKKEEPLKENYDRWRKDREVVADTSDTR